MARSTNLDELAGMYHGGPESFFEDWREFTSTPTPQRVQRDPRLVLVARSFDGRTRQALEFLVQHGLPVQVLQVAFYVDASGRRFLDVEWETEPEAHAITGEDHAPDSILDVRKDYLQITLAKVAADVSTPAA